MRVQIARDDHDEPITIMTEIFTQNTSFLTNLGIILPHYDVNFHLRILYFTEFYLINLC